MGSVYERRSKLISEVGVNVSCAFWPSPVVASGCANLPTLSALFSSQFRHGELTTCSNKRIAIVFVCLSMTSAAMVALSK